MPFTRESRPVLLTLLCIDVYTDREVWENRHSGVNQETSGEQEDKASSSFSPWVWGWRERSKVVAREAGQDQNRERC